MTKKAERKPIQQEFQLARGLNVSLPRYYHIWLDALGSNPDPDEISHPERGKFIHLFDKWAASRYPASNKGFARIVRLALDELYSVNYGEDDFGEDEFVKRTPIVDGPKQVIGHSDMHDYGPIIMDAGRLRIYTADIKRFLTRYNHHDLICRRLYEQTYETDIIVGVKSFDEPTRRVSFFPDDKHTILQLCSDITRNSNVKGRGTVIVWATTGIPCLPDFTLLTDEMAFVTAFPNSQSVLVWENGLAPSSFSGAFKAAAEQAECALLSVRAVQSRRPEPLLAVIPEVEKDR